MSRRRCCCVCPQFRDDFTRIGPSGMHEDTTDMGLMWEEVEGDWGCEQRYFAFVDDYRTVASEVYHGSAGTPGAMLISTFEIPPDENGEDGHMHVQIDILDEQVGDVYWLYLNYLNETTHCKAKYVRESANTASLYLYKNADLLDSIENFSCQATGIHTFHACIGDITGRPSGPGRGPCIFRAWVSGPLCTCNALAEVEPIANGNRAGFGHDNSSHASYFDNYWCIQLDIPKCPTCGYCYCEDKVLPVRLTATYANGDDPCDILDGITVEMEGARCGTTPYYMGEVEEGCLENTGGPLVLKLWCVESDLDQHQLEVYYPPAYWPKGACVDGIGLLEPLEGSTCDPLYLIFEVDYATSVQDCPDACLPCGKYPGAMGDPSIVHYYIIITE